MPRKLPPAAGMGRKKGVPNKVTADVRKTIALIAERNIKSVEVWLKEVADKDPGRAMELYLRMIEYHIPKLSRAEVTGENGSPLQVQLVKYADTQ